MSVPGQLRAMVDGRIRAFGGGLRITLRERHTLKLQSTGGVVSALAASGAHASGATAIDLTATGGLIGTLPKGAKITIAATVYTTTAETHAENGVLADVPITPALAGNVADGAAAAITQPYGDFTYTAMRSTLQERDAMQGAPDASAIYRLSAVGQRRAPKRGDAVLIGGVEVDTVTELGKPSPDGQPLFFTIFVGSAG